jgi:hypothetical protein
MRDQALLAYATRHNEMVDDLNSALGELGKTQDKYQKTELFNSEFE